MGRLNGQCRPGRESLVTEPKKKKPGRQPLPGGAVRLVLTLTPKHVAQLERLAVRLGCVTATGKPQPAWAVRRILDDYEFPAD